MIVNHKYKFIFLKTRKTASTSMEIALSQFCGPEDIVTPISYNDEIVRSELGYTGPSNYIHNSLLFNIDKFIPWLKIKPSRYMFYNHAPALYVKSKLGDDVWNDYFKFCFERNPYDKAISLYYWETKNKDASDISDINQVISNPKKVSNWGVYTIDDEIAVDFVGRYEHIHEDLSFIEKKLKLPSELKLPKTKNTHRKSKKHYSELLDESTCALIENLCSKEINAFSYDYMCSKKEKS